MFVFTTAEKDLEEEARGGEEEEVKENEVEEEEEEVEVDKLVDEEEEMERMGKAVILPSHLPSPASEHQDELLDESPVPASATGDKITEEKVELEGSGLVVSFEEGSGEGSGNGAPSPKVIGDATKSVESPKQEKSVSGGDINRSSNIQQSGLLFILVTSFWMISK